MGEVGSRERGSTVAEITNVEFCFGGKTGITGWSLSTVLDAISSKGKDGEDFLLRFGSRIPS